VAVAAPDAPRQMQIEMRRTKMLIRNGCVGVQLLHQLALRTDALKFLQQQGAQQLLRRYRRPADLGMKSHK
jgi:hypothetical protein